MYFPSGKIMDDWFSNIKRPSIDDYDKKYYLSDYVKPNTDDIITNDFQSLIDTIYNEGGGLLIVDKGLYKTGAIFLRNNVSLYVGIDGYILGSDDISDYPVMETRIEGETCMYYPALINAFNTSGISIFGHGTINGNGLKSWKAFWQRRKWNPKCLNKDEQRPRLIYISDSDNVTIDGLTLEDSHFWTTHIYRCNHITYSNLTIRSPYHPVKAPSTDAIDIDYCSDVLIRKCYFSVNDDAIALKGGKGPYADSDINNGPNERIIIEDCKFGFCHSCLTCGSESIFNNDVIFRNCEVLNAKNVLWLKMRPDTPQIYKNIYIENIYGRANNFLFVKPWTQFFDLKGRNDMPRQLAENISFKDIWLKVNCAFNVSKSEQYNLKKFKFENVCIKAAKNGFSEDLFDGVDIINLNVEVLNG